MAKIPAWDETEAIPAFDDTEPIEAPKPTGSLLSQILPRFSKADDQGKGYGPQVGASMLDLLSLPGRALGSMASAKVTGNPWQETYSGYRPSEKDQNYSVEATPLGETKGLLRDPGLAAALMAAPFTGGASIPALLAGGATGGTLSAAAHQGDRMLEGEEFSPGQAAAEIGLNTVLPVGAKKLIGPFSIGRGKKIIDALIKPSAGVQENIEHIGDKAISDAFFREGVDSPIPFTGGLEGSYNRVNDIRSAANKEFSNVMDRNEGVNVNLLDALSGTSGRMAKEFLDEGKHAGVLPGISKAEREWLGTAELKDPNGIVPLRFSQGFKQELGDAGNFLTTDPGEVKGAARYATQAYRDLNRVQNELVPELKPLNKTLSDTRPLKDALEDALPRIRKNNAISPSDLWALAPAAVGGGAGLAAGSPGAAAAAVALPLIINRMSKNPTVASQLYRAGESMYNPGAIGELRKKAIERSLSYELFGGDK